MTWLVQKRKKNAEFDYSCLEAVSEKCGIEETLDKACPSSESMILLGVIYNTITRSFTGEKKFDLQLIGV